MLTQVKDVEKIFESGQIMFVDVEIIYRGAVRLYVYMDHMRYTYAQCPQRSVVGELGNLNRTAIR